MSALQAGAVYLGPHHTDRQCIVATGPASSAVPSATYGCKARRDAPFVKQPTHTVVRCRHGCTNSTRGGTNRAARARTAVGLHYQLKEKFVRCWAEEELDEE